MSLQLLIDEDSQAKPLIRLLKAAGHNVLTINNLDMAGAPDEEVLAFAKQENRVVLTRNCDDFEALHMDDSDHAGILLIYRDSDRSKNMSYQDVVRAISNLETVGVTFSTRCFRLNQWMYYLP